MKLWAYQTDDVFSWRNDDYSVLRIHRLKILWWVWIWGRVVIQPPVWLPQVHDEARERRYMNQHPELWPPGNHYSDIYAKHHYAPIGDTILIAGTRFVKVKRNGEADNGSAGG
jgi:hypothetical protein